MKKRKLKKGEWVLLPGKVVYCLRYEFKNCKWEYEILDLATVAISPMIRNKRTGEYPTRREAEAAIRRIKKAMVG